MKSIISKFGNRNNPPDNMVPDRRKFLTIADILSVDNDQAWNALLDHCSIERNVLFDTPREAENAMKGQGGRNVSQAVMPDGMTCVIRNGVISNFRNKDAGRPLKYINADMKALIKSINEDILSKNKELEGLQETFKVASKKRSDLNEEVRSFKAELKKLERKKDNCSRKISSIEREIANIRQAEDEREDPSQVQDEINEVEAELKEQVREFEKAKSNRDEIVSAYESAKSEHDKCVAKVNDLQSVFDKKIEISRNLEDEKDEMERMVKAVEQKIEVLETKIRDMNREVKSEERDISSLTKRLESTLGERPDKEMFDYVDPKTKRGPRNVDELQKDIRRLNKQIEKNENEYTVKDVKKMRDQYDKIEARYNEKNKKFKSTMERYTGLSDSCKERHNQWENFRKSASKKTNKYFLEILSARGSIGELDFDHENKSLSMELVMNANQTQETVAASQITDTSALSGGERSSVTLSLLMALGETIDCPFRLMDELDVYMDPSNRMMLMNVIARAAERHFDRQMIMLTPNNIDGMLDDQGDGESSIRVLEPENLNILTLPSRREREGL